MRDHPFGAAKLTTASDRLREPALNWGQLVRTLLLFTAFALALALASRESHADPLPHDPGLRPLPGELFSQGTDRALAILQDGHVAPEAMLGSWASTMGQTQFMPSAFKRYAIDFDGHGRKDIWHNVPDALGSAAYFLKKHGWRAGESWVSR